MDMGSRLGVMKTAAARLGIPFGEYQVKVEAGLRWCHQCQTWKMADHFGDDRSRKSGKDAICLQCRRTNEYETATRLPGQPREVAARRAVDEAVLRGLLPAPETLACALCGLEAEVYHHHLGHSREHRLDVIPLCGSCSHLKPESLRHVK